MPHPPPPTRADLAKFLPDQRSIRAFEALFDLFGGGQDDVSALIQQVFVDAGIANTKGVQALGELVRVRELLDFVATDSGANQALGELVRVRELLELIAHGPQPKPLPNVIGLDSTRYNLNPPALEPGDPVPVPGELIWSSLDDTLSMGAEDIPVYKLGMATYALVSQETGSTIPKGTVMGFAGAGVVHDHINTAPYIADGTQPSLTVIGILAHDLDPIAGLDHPHGRLQVWGELGDIDTTGTPVGEVWSVGDILYASPTTAGAMTIVKPTAPDESIPVAAILRVDATDGLIFVRPTIEQDLLYGTFVDTTNQTIGTTATPQAITFNATQVSNGVTIGTPASRIVVADSGLYNFQFSIQVTTSTSSAKFIEIWPRINGVDVPNSNTRVGIINNNDIRVPAWNFILSLNANDYFELVWATSDITVTLAAVAATGYSPAVPSVILTVSQEQQ